MDAQVGESSACATALLCGVKTNYETVGLDSSAKFDNCLSSKTARVPSIVDWAQEKGKIINLLLLPSVSANKLVIMFLTYSQDSLLYT